MTKKEAIYILRNAAWLGSNEERQKVEEAVEVVAKAIEALNHSEIPNSFGKDTNVPSNDVPDTNVGDTISRQVAIDTEGLDEQIRCEMCRNPMHTDRGCDGNCKYDEKLYERIMQILGERIKLLPSAQQEPKSPLYYGDGYSEGKMVYDSAECPNCGYIYDEGDHVWGEPYCPHCGQALDWYMRGEQDE